FDLLKVVGSSPARRASPEGDSPARSASRSSAPHTWPWVSIFSAFGCLAMGKPPAREAGIIGAIGRSRQFCTARWRLRLKSPPPTDTVAGNLRDSPENPKGLKDKQERLACA